MEKNTIWQCHNPACNAQYSEYVNGCPKCSTGEPGGSHKVSILDEFHPAYEEKYPIGGYSPEESNNDAHEKEIMMQAFEKITQLFEGRQWIMEGRGSYPYNDDRYKQEVRYMYDEFESIRKDTWANIQSKSIDYRKKIIEQYLKDNPPQGAVWVKASEFKYEVGVAYSAKDSKSRGAGTFDDFGNFFWGDHSMTAGDSQDDLLILDESPSKESDVVEWISVDDRLPELTEPLIGYNDNDEQEIIIENFQVTVWGYDNTIGQYKARLTKSGWSEISSVSNRRVYPTHWRPLPEPPKQ